MSNSCQAQHFEALTFRAADLHSCSGFNLHENRDVDCTVAQGQPMKLLADEPHRRYKVGKGPQEETLRT